MYYEITVIYKYKISKSLVLIILNKVYCYFEKNKGYWNVDSLSVRYPDIFACVQDGWCVHLWCLYVQIHKCQNAIWEMIWHPPETYRTDTESISLYANLVAGKLRNFDVWFRPVGVWILTLPLTRRPTHKIDAEAVIDNTVGLHFIAFENVGVMFHYVNGTTYKSCIITRASSTAYYISLLQNVRDI